MKNLRGYIFSRPFEGQRIPQHVQNIIVNNYCKKNNFNFLLSSTEYAMQDSQIILENIINELKNIDGIVLYSLWLLPSLKDNRGKIFKKVLKANKELHFAVEDIVFKNENNIDLIEDIFLIKNNADNDSFNMIGELI